MVESLVNYDNLKADFIVKPGRWVGSITYTGYLRPCRKEQREQKVSLTKEKKESITQPRVERGLPA
jgi:hypothetical protein